MNGNLRNLYNLAINSFIAYILSYIAVLIPTQIVTLLVAKSFNFQVYLNHFKITFLASDYSSLWTQNSVVSIYISAPIFTLITGAFFIFSRSILSTNNYSVNLFLTWGYAHCMNIFFGGLIIGIPLAKGFGYVPIWLYFPQYLQIILIAISFSVMLLNSYSLVKQFVSLSFSEYYLRNPSSLLAFKVAIVFLPSILANVFFYLIKLPDNSLYESLLLITMYVQLIGIIPYTYIHFEIKDENKKVALSFTMLAWMIVATILLIAFRLLCNN